MKDEIVMTALLGAALALTSLSVIADDAPRASYYKDGELHITVLGSPETKTLTTGYWDFKPSWSMTEDRLVFFRRLKNAPDVGKWITAMCIINADGSTRQVSTDDNADYRYPHGEASPN